MSAELALGLLSDFSFKSNLLKDAQCFLKLLRWYVEAFGWNDDVQKLLKAFAKSIASIGVTRSWMSIGNFLPTTLDLLHRIKSRGVVQGVISVESLELALSAVCGALDDTDTLSGVNLLNLDPVTLGKLKGVSRQCSYILCAISLLRALADLLNLRGSPTKLEGRAPRAAEAAGGEGVESGQQEGAAGSRPVVEEGKAEGTVETGTQVDTTHATGVDIHPPSTEVREVEDVLQLDERGTYGFRLLMVLKAAIDFGLVADGFTPWVPDEGSSHVLSLLSALIGTYKTWRRATLL